MRVAVLGPLRRQHGLHLRAETVSGSTAAKHSLETRLAWAREEWLLAVRTAVRLLRRPVSLTSVRAQVPFNAAALESLVRCSAGLQARAFALRAGGVYKLVRLLSPAAAEQVLTRQWAREVFRNLMVLEEAVQSPDVPSGLAALRAFR